MFSVELNKSKRRSAAGAVVGGKSSWVDKSLPTPIISSKTESAYLLLAGACCSWCWIQISARYSTYPDRRIPMSPNHGPLDDELFRNSQQHHDVNLRPAVRSPRARTTNVDSNNLLNVGLLCQGLWVSS
jgi:hypothetical protein